ncbi:MAG: transcriptional regulator, partial [Nisaea sp.]|nr:transcriptional regulator [Nisaea sp.]
ETGRYGRGDFQELDGEIEHQPWVDGGEPCICLAVTDAPLRFKSLAAKLAQPLLGI